MKHPRFLVASAALAVLLGGAIGCGPDDEEVVEDTAPAGAEIEEIDDPDRLDEMEGDPMIASADLMTADGELVGTVRFRQLETGDVQVTADLSNVPVTTGAEHGFHVHETGECTPPDFTSAGGHFAPMGHPHGAPTDAERHAGDLGNITVATGGTATLNLTTDMLTVGDGPSTVVGKAVILHEGRDDLESQPTGDAGGRLACGVVALAGEQFIDETLVGSDPPPAQPNL